MHKLFVALAALGVAIWWYRWEDPFIKKSAELVALHDRYAYGREYDIYS
jgi:hypothetical protein